MFVVNKTGTSGKFSYFELASPSEMDGILDGKNLPDYMELARYVFTRPRARSSTSAEVRETALHRIFEAYEGLPSLQARYWTPSRR